MLLDEMCRACPNLRSRVDLLPGRDAGIELAAVSSVFRGFSAKAWAEVEAWAALRSRIPELGAMPDELLAAMIFVRFDAAGAFDFDFDALANDVLALVEAAWN